VSSASPASFAAPLTPGLVTGLLLAGGQSRRMGRDKARLPHPADQRPIILHQLENLRHALGPNAPLALSLRGGADAYEDLVGSEIVRLRDDGTRGPLGGLAAGLAAARSPWLLLLAVDMPAMHAAFLRRLLDAALAANCGLVPARPAPDGALRFEPLCALYPVAPEFHALVTRALASEDWSLQSLLRAAETAGMLRAWPVTAEDAATLENWNTPADLREPAPPHS
jgi:molybdenum cofactor guanylyltransferase